MTMKNTNSISGFLVVLMPEYAEIPFPENVINFKYEGIGRVPLYYLPEQPTDYPAESAAMDAYVFGDYKDLKTNLIPTLDKATELLVLFSESPRRFEIILCCEGPESAAIRQVAEQRTIEELGYDVAIIESIVDDFCHSDWAKEFLARLNQHGLFSSREDAEEYLRQYVEHEEYDWDCPYRIIYIVRVK